MKVQVRETDRTWTRDKAPQHFELPFNHSKNTSLLQSIIQGLLTNSQVLWLLLPNHQPSWFTEPHNSQPKLSSAHIKFRAAGYSQTVSFLQIKDPNLNLCVKYSMWVSTLQALWHREAAMIWEMLWGGTQMNTQSLHNCKSECLRPQWLRQKSQLTSIYQEPKNVNSITFFSEPQKLTLERESKPEWLFSRPKLDVWEIFLLG